jgi:hypothetical protein
MLKSEELKPGSSSLNLFLQFLEGCLRMVNSSVAKDTRFFCRASRLQALKKRCGSSVFMDPTLSLLFPASR